MEYRTMNRKELAAELNISTKTLGRRMKKLNPEFLEQIKDKSLLFENEVQYIYEQITNVNKWKKVQK